MNKQLANQTPNTVFDAPEYTNTVIPSGLILLIGAVVGHWTQLLTVGQTGGLVCFATIAVYSGSIGRTLKWVHVVTWEQFRHAFPSISTIQPLIVITNTVGLGLAAALFLLGVTGVGTLALGGVFCLTLLDNYCDRRVGLHESQ